MFNSEELQIEACSELDLEICASEVFNTSFGKRYYPSLKILKNVLEEAFRRDRIYIGRYKENIVGFVWFSKDTMFGKFPYLNLIFVFEKYRKLGVGSKLLECFETKELEEYKKPKMKLFLVVKDDNEKAINFYIKNKYNSIGRIDGLFRASTNEILMMKQMNYKF